MNLTINQGNINSKYPLFYNLPEYLISPSHLDQLWTVVHYKITWHNLSPA